MTERKLDEKSYNAQSELLELLKQQAPQKFTCLDMAFKNDDQLKTNTALQMDSAKIVFKVI